MHLPPGRNNTLPSGGQRDYRADSTMLYLYLLDRFVCLQLFFSQLHPCCGSSKDPRACRHHLCVFKSVCRLLILICFHKVCVRMCVYFSLMVSDVAVTVLWVLCVTNLFHLSVMVLFICTWRTHTCQCTAYLYRTHFTYTVPSPVVNINIVVPIMTFVLYICQRMVCTVMYASWQ